MKGSLTRTLSLFLFLSILMLLLAVCVCYYAAYKNAEVQAVDHAQALLDDTVQSIQNELTDVMDSAKMLSNESSLYQFIKSDVSRRFDQKQLLQSLLKSFTDFKPLVTRMNLYIRDKSTLLSGAQEGDVYSPLLYSLFLRIKDDYRLLAPYRSGVLTKCYVREDGRTNFAILMPVYAPVAVPRDSDYLGSLVALCDMQRIGSLLPDSGQRMMLLREDKNVLYTNDQAFTLQKAQGNGIISKTIPGTDWILYTVAAPVNLSGQISEVRTVCIVACAVAFIAQAFLMLALRRAMIKPIMHIANQTDSIYDGTLKVKNPSFERNELTRLTNGINGMLARVQQLNSQMLDTRLRLYKERVMFLQTQMNPHFLYNNLACIRGMAGKGSAKAIRDMASGMAAIYRYCAQSLPVATLEEEFTCIRMYESIYALRKENLNYDIRITAEENTLGLTTPRMFLQPLVENAFRHGYSDSGNGEVEIAAVSAQNRLIIRVTDHGIGMAQEKLDAFNATVPDDDTALSGHIGIMNIWRRIQIIFGPGSGMRFDLTPGGGLTVTVTLIQKDEQFGKNETT
jgi:sensor histidine kinase YesM